MDMERLKQALWLPLSIGPGRAEVIACYPDDPSAFGRDPLAAQRSIRSISASRCRRDLVRIIEHNQDLNPRFPPVAGRTPLAKVRTFLAERRSMLSCQRTALAKGRTGLALLRTGLSFITISLVLFRIFGIGMLSLLEAVLFLAGLAAAVDGLVWYLPVRAPGRTSFACDGDPADRRHLGAGRASIPALPPGSKGTSEVPDAESLRAEWSSLQPGHAQEIPGQRQDRPCRRAHGACLLPDRHGPGQDGAFLHAHRHGLHRPRDRAARQFPADAWTVLDAGIIIMGVGDGR